jgi:ABC-type transport system substrate-binding protein
MPDPLLPPDSHRRALVGALASLGAGSAAIGSGAAAAAASASPAAGASGGPRVLRCVLRNRDNGFDPAFVSDVISAALANSLFDAPLTYDPLARPAKLKLNTAAAMPEPNADFTRWLFRIKPGIEFTPHPAFGGKPRELVAADYVFSVKRYYDPAVRSPTLFHYEGAGLLGLTELRKKALDAKAPFDYDTEVEGIRALDRYSFEVRTARPAPRLPYVFATGAVSGALAREVVVAEGKNIAEKPIGTGAFVLDTWLRGARIVLVRNPRHRHEVYEAEPEPADPADVAAATRLKGRALPLVDRVELQIVEEAQPRWLSFLNGQADLLEVPPEFTSLASPNGQLAPNLARQGVQLRRTPVPVSWYTYFAMENPVTGGYTPDKVALRRAVALAYDGQREIDIARHGQGVVAQTLVPPGVSGYDSKLKTLMSDHSLARARALLDLFGYVDKDGDGWRERPDGQPLVLEMYSEPTQLARQLQSLWHKATKALGVKVEFRVAQWQENIKASRAGQRMMWNTGWSAATPDGSYFLDVLHSRNKGQSNHARFGVPEVDALVERQRALPDGPERQALIAEALRRAVALMPMKVTSHHMETWVSNARVVGLKPHPFVRDYWRFTDIEPEPSA